jgi:type I restriction enzyme R subunit
MTNNTTSGRLFTPFSITVNWFATTKSLFSGLAKSTSQLEKQGYEYIYAPNIAPDSDNPLRNSFEEVILPNRLNNAVTRINPSIPHDAQQEAIKEISRIHSPELLGFPRHKTAQVC